MSERPAWSLERAGQPELHSGALQKIVQHHPCDILRDGEKIKDIGWVMLLIQNAVPKLYIYL